ncbi:hypothetical protein HN51_007189, partial [Arachis hypogaea]
RLEVEESEYHPEDLVPAPDPVEVLHVDGEGSDVGEEGSEGFEGDEGFEEESEIHDEFGDGFYDNWEERAIDEIADLGCMNLKEITAEEIKSLHFPDREVAFLFYNLYAKMNGFAARSQMRSREAFSDLQSTVGEMVLQSPLRSLERSAASVLTREIFLIFRPMLSRACTLKVRSCTFTACSDIYSLFRSGDSAREWRVSHYRNGSFFKCSCMRMETLGIPCDHIIAVFHHLDITEMPASVVLERWSKDARSRVRAFMEKGPFCWDSMVTCRNWMLNDLCRELCVLASARVDDFVDVTGKLRNEISHLKSKRVSPSGEGTDPLLSSTLEDCVRDPQVLRHNKRCKFGVGRQPSSKGIKRCGICRAVGHNRLSCSQRHTHGQRHTAVDSGTQRRAVYEEADYSDYEDSWEECHLWSGHDTSEKDEEESCEEDHYLDVSLSEP